MSRVSAYYAKNKKEKAMKKAIITTISIISVCALAVGIYAGDFYHAEETAVNCITSPDKSITVSEKDGNIIFSPKSPTSAIIFYPGGKVEAESYAPLLTSLAENGILTILIKMPLNLAVLDVNAAKGIKNDFPEIKNWYMAGHSLGGSMAASFLSETEEEFSGLILLASYSTSDLSNSDFDVLSIYGSKDKVLNKASYNEYKTNLPENYKEIIIEGGCHAYFGDYGLQEGDGTPEITKEKQVSETTKEIILFLGSQDL